MTVRSSRTAATAIATWAQSAQQPPASASALPKRHVVPTPRKFCGAKLGTVSPATFSAVFQAGEAATWTPSVAYGVGATRRSSLACSARTSPISGPFDQIVKLAPHG